MDDPLIACERCGQGGALVYRGWNLWCQPCQDKENSWYWDEKGGRIGA